MDDDKFKKIIESCHLNFLIGSGASRNYINTLGNVENLLTELSKDPVTEKKQVLDVSIKKDYFNNCIKGNLGLIDTSIITNVDEYKATKTNYLDFLIAINIILLRRRGNLIGKQVNLFTTNMDIFIDQTLEEMNVEYNDGFSGKLNPTFSTSNFRKTIFQKSPHYENKAELPLFNLFKLHGSVTWKIHKDKIVFDKDLTTLKRIDSVKINGSLIESFKDNEGIDKTVESLYKEAEGIPFDKSFEEFQNAYNQLFLINPTKEKFEITTTQYTFYELLRMYSNELEKENSILFVFGFSFADEHIREITKRVANSNPTLLICVFAFNDDAKKDIEEKLNLTEFKFKNIEVISAGDLSSLNQSWFVKLANELDKDLYAKKKNDVIVNITLPKVD